MADGFKLMGLLMSFGNRGKAALVTALGYAAEYDGCLTRVAKEIARSDGMDAVAPPDVVKYRANAKAAILGLQAFLKES